MQSRAQRLLLLLFVLILAVFFYGVFGNNAILLSLEGEAVNLTGPEGSSFSVPYSKIASMELREDFDPGAAVNGGLKSRIRYGLWRNEELGDYQLFASDKIDVVILLRTTEGEALVFNYESVGTTRKFFETHSAFLVEQGYAVATA